MVFRKADIILKKLLNASCFILSIAVTILMVIEIAARFLFEHAFRGLPEIYLLLVMWLYMLGASLASANRSHLRIGILDQLFKSARIKRFYDLLLAVISFVIMLFFIRWSWGLVDWGIKRPQTTPILYLPWLSSMLSIFVASILVTGYGLRDLVSALAAFRSHTTQDLPEEKE
jgi:TRAP-type C4-dicarboxylate transport system permease small subunit